MGYWNDILYGFSLSIVYCERRISLIKQNVKEETKKYFEHEQSSGGHSYKKIILNKKKEFLFKDYATAHVKNHVSLKHKKSTVLKSVMNEKDEFAIKWLKKEFNLKTKFRSVSSLYMED